MEKLSVDAGEVCNEATTILSGIIKEMQSISQTLDGIEKALNPESALTVSGRESELYDIKEEIRKINETLVNIYEKISLSELKVDETVKSHRQLKKIIATSDKECAIIKTLKSIPDIKLQQMEIHTCRKKEQEADKIAQAEIDKANKLINHVKANYMDIEKKISKSLELLREREVSIRALKCTEEKAARAKANEEEKLKKAEEMCRILERAEQQRAKNVECVQELPENEFLELCAPDAAKQYQELLDYSKRKVRELAFSAVNYGLLKGLGNPESYGASKQGLPKELKKYFQDGDIVESRKIDKKNRLVICYNGGKIRQIINVKGHPGNDDGAPSQSRY